MGLLDELIKYIKDASPGGLLNPETKPVADRVVYASGLLDPNSQISRDAQNWHKRTQAGLKDQLAGRNTQEAEQAYQSMMQAAGIAPVGMIAWHGSPHKFDKFDLSKIGTGEGAQAYGHGLYLAESPEVAQTYGRSNTPGNRSFNSVDYNGQKFPAGSRDGELLYDITTKGRAAVIRNLQAQADRLATINPKESTNLLNRIEYAKTVQPDAVRIDAGNLYKTDIPDEAVARFLDWDKPLSQQAPEVQAALQRAAEIRAKQTGGAFGPLDMGQVGREVVPTLGEGRLREAGIPGIRYLDGGSRSAGQGSSNFVVFQPEMIRILERNGQPTGLQPWKVGEWK